MQRHLPEESREISFLGVNQNKNIYVVLYVETHSNGFKISPKIRVNFHVNFHVELNVELIQNNTQILCEFSDDTPRRISHST